MTASETRIRQITDADWPNVWAMMKPVIRAGETYPYARDMTAAGAQKMWFEIPEASYVAEEESGKLLGTYYIKPNQPALGAHVANCGYIVSENARGRGIASRMCEHSQAEAVRLGCRAMQYNLVVKTNAASVYLWKKMGFDVAGTLPGAFHHPAHGYVDAFVMYKELLK
jgi:L-amino acid N-acyltransferase YncA